MQQHADISMHAPAGARAQSPIRPEPGTWRAAGAAEARGECQHAPPYCRPTGVHAPPCTASPSSSCAGRPAQHLGPRAEPLLGLLVHVVDALTVRRIQRAGQHMHGGAAVHRWVGLQSAAARVHVRAGKRLIAGVASGLHCWLAAERGQSRRGTSRTHRQRLLHRHLPQQPESSPRVVCAARRQRLAGVPDGLPSWRLRGAEGRRHVQQPRACLWVRLRVRQARGCPAGALGRPGAGSGCAGGALAASSGVAGGAAATAQAVRAARALGGPVATLAGG